MQTDMYGRYHINDPSTVLQSDDGVGAAAPAGHRSARQHRRPAADRAAARDAAEPAGLQGRLTAPITTRRACRPYYVINKLQRRLDRPTSCCCGPTSRSPRTAPRTSSPSFIVAKLRRRRPRQAAGRTRYRRRRIDGPGIVSQKILNDQNVSSTGDPAQPAGLRRRVRRSHPRCPWTSRSSTCGRCTSWPAAARRRAPTCRMLSPTTRSTSRSPPPSRRRCSWRSRVANPETLEGAADQAGNPVAPTTNTTDTTTPPNTGTTAPGSTAPPATTGGSTPPVSVPAGTSVAALIDQANQALADARRWRSRTATSLATRPRSTPADEGPRPGPSPRAASSRPRPTDDEPPLTSNRPIRSWSPNWAAGPASLALHAAGWSSLVARRAHNPKVVGSNPTPATI